MKIKLLDTNIISVYLSGKRRGDAAYPLIADRFSKLGRPGFHIPLMSVMEIEFGLAIGDEPALSDEVKDERKQVSVFLKRYPKAPINSDCARFYVPLRARVFERHGNRKPGSKGFKEKKTHELKDRVTDLSIGIDERDLIIVSSAYAGNYTLVTLDRKKEMAAIISAARELEAEGLLPEMNGGRASKLDVEYWDLED